MDRTFSRIGMRLKAFRLEQDWAVEKIAEHLGVSRAAVYRIESGEIIKIDTLFHLAKLFGTTVAALLESGVEYYAQASDYFERMREIEGESDQIIASFPPFSYLLTTNHYAQDFRTMLLEMLSGCEQEKSLFIKEIDKVIDILERRKITQKRRNMSVINFVSFLELERWLQLGVIGRFDLSETILHERRKATYREIENLLHIVESEPMGIQIGFVREMLPNTSFQLFRTSEKTYLGVSPFRLGGELPNIQNGIAMITADQEPVGLYEKMVQKLWEEAVKGREAALVLKQILKRSGISSGL